MPVLVMNMKCMVYSTIILNELVSVQLAIFRGEAMLSIGWM